MDLLILVLVFIGGALLGLIFYPLARMIDSREINGFLDWLVKMLTAPFARLLHCYQKRADFNKMEQGVNLAAIEKIDPREQQISDSAQTIRSIMLSLATAVQRTDKAATVSSQTLDDVRSSIDRMELPLNLAEAHAMLMLEIDKVIFSNDTLREELKSSQDLLVAQRQQIEALRTAVRIDGLTQLANRAYFDEKLSEMISLRKRYDEPFSLLMIDVDNFKVINDTYGHPAGDRIIKGVAFKIKDTLRSSDFLARFGGDEFALILIKAGGKAAADVAWKLCESLRESRFLLDDQTVNITLSIGVAEVEADDTEESLLKRADAALYRVKQVGRNSVLLADSP